jgi:hypothetical protein
MYAAVPPPVGVGKQDNADQLNPSALKPFAEEHVEQRDSGGELPTPTRQR